jgi:putative AbiEi antitoxin of type IV toxin-antitoxin system/uncharacterized protein DUF559/transcriptional regulator with AbiEi antitoxin domain of type IV toxin-antitoxin system
MIGLLQMQVSYNLKRNGGSADHRIGVLAARQHGVFARAQAIRLGVTEGEIRWRVGTGRWERVFPKVYRLAGVPGTWHQHAMAACLHWGVHAVISHRAAAKFRSLDGVREARAEISVSRNRNRPRSSRVRVHWLSEAIPKEDITTIDGIPVTKPARTLLDLASTEPDAVVERCLDDALRRRLVSLSFLERWLADPRRKRHRGAALMGRLLEARATLGVTESPLEAQALTLLRSAGLPIPMLQYIVEEDGRFVARLDLAYPEKRVALEIDGFRFHDTRESFDTERARGNELQAIGWKVLRLTSQHLERSPEEVAEWIRRALDDA